MAKSTKTKNKSGNKSKPAKAKKLKSPAKAKAPKAPKEKKEIALKTPVSAPVIATPKPEVRAIVVETAREEKKAPVVTSSEPPVALSAQPVEPDAIDIMAKELNKTIRSYVRGISKPMLEDYLSKLPKSTPFYVVPRYSNKNTFTIDITDGTKKVSIPSTGTYALVG
jgi:hypothetical protein